MTMILYIVVALITLILTLRNWRKQRDLDPDAVFLALLFSWFWPLFLSVVLIRFLIYVDFKK